MTSDDRAFEDAYGRPVPPALKALYDDPVLLANVPRRVALPGKPFVMEIQYYQGLAEQTAADVARQRFAFAIDSDGHELLVDLSGPDLPVFQREFGDVDSIDLTLVELLTAAGGDGTRNQNPGEPRA